MSSLKSEHGDCPFKRDENTSCTGHRTNGPIVCNLVVDDFRRGNMCSRFYREAALNDIKPDQFCCPPMDYLFHDCAEDSGYLAGAFDLRKYPNDGKDVWRNYSRIKFSYCPFCGKQLVAPGES